MSAISAWAPFLHKRHFCISAISAWAPFLHERHFCMSAIVGLAWNSLFIHSKRPLFFLLREVHCQFIVFGRQETLVYRALIVFACLFPWQIPVLPGTPPAWSASGVWRYVIWACFSLCWKGAIAWARKPKLTLNILKISCVFIWVFSKLLICSWRLPWFDLFHYWAKAFCCCFFGFFFTFLLQDPLGAILVIFGRRALIFFVWKLLKKCKMTPLLCACAVVITLETQKCRKWAPRSVQFKISLRRI